MMKAIIPLMFMMALPAIAAEAKVRKVSSSSYFVCLIERESNDKKMFKKEYHFPFPVEADERYELKGSMRWNNISIIFHQNGEVQIEISELINGKKVTGEKTHQLGKDPQFDSMKVQVDVKKDDVVIPYHVHCYPE